jgi:hypothetical protein
MTNSASTPATISAAATAAGHPCGSSIGATIGWAYAGNPGICTNPGCCGASGSCQGVCAFGAHAGRSCSAQTGHYSPLCYCSPPAPPSPPTPPPPPLICGGLVAAHTSCEGPNQGTNFGHQSSPETCGSIAAAAGCNVVMFSQSCAPATAAQRMSSCAHMCRR